MTVRSQSELSDVLRPMNDEFIANVKRVSEMEDDGSVQFDEDTQTLTLELPVAIFEKPTPYETQPTGNVSKMVRTRSFRSFYRASANLAKLSEQPSLGYEELGQIMISRTILSEAKKMAETDRRVTPELAMRIGLCEALADITAFTGSIIENHDQPRMLDAYEELFFADTYEKLLDIGRELMRKHHQPTTVSERASYSGLAHEVVFHLLQYRQRSAMRFSTAASAYDDYFRPNNKFDAKAYNLKLGREKAVEVQVKTSPKQYVPGQSETLRVIYGTLDLRNTLGDTFWDNTMQAKRELPTLSALLDEAAGDTTSSEKLDEITARLHSRLFS